jgi:ATP-dependent Zn protease
MNLSHMNWVGILVNWFPMILLIAVWLFFLGNMQRLGGIYSNQKRAADALERIAVALEKRSF